MATMKSPRRRSAWAKLRLRTSVGRSALLAVLAALAMFAVLAALAVLAGCASLPGPQRVPNGLLVPEQPYLPGAEE